MAAPPGRRSAAEDVEAVRQGCANLGRHIENVRRFGVPLVVAVNHFTTDTEAEIEAVRHFTQSLGVEAVLCRHWADGSAGIEELATKVAALADSGEARFRPLYPDQMGLFDKIETIAMRIYHAGEVSASKAVRDQLSEWEAQGYGALPVCMAKTPYSFSADPGLRGAPSGHVLPVREVRLSAGAGFVVAICGDIMTMPGLPRVPSAERIRLSGEGLVEGLF